MNENNDKKNSVSDLSLETFNKLSDEAKLQSFKLLSEHNRRKVFSSGCKELRYKLFDLLLEDDKPCYLAVYFSEDEIIKDNLLQKILPGYRICVFEYLKSDLAKFKFFSLLREGDMLAAFNMFQSDKFKSMAFGLLPEGDRLEAFGKFESDEAKYGCFEFLPIDAKEECFDIFALEQKILIYKKKLNFEERDILFSNITQELGDLANDGKINDVEIDTIVFTLLNHLSFEYCLKRFEQFCGLSFGSFNIDYCKLFLKNLNSHCKFYCFKHGLPEEKKLEVFRYQTKANRLLFFPQLSKNDRLKVFKEIISPEDRYFYFALLNLEAGEMSEAFKLIPEKDRELALKILPYEKDELRKKINDDKIKPLGMLKAKKMQESENKVPEFENDNETAISWLEKID